MQIVGLGIKSKDFCRGLRVILYRSADVRILYHIFAFSGAGCIHMLFFISLSAPMTSTAFVFPVAF